MFFALAVGVTIIVLAYVFVVRPKDIPQTAQPSPYAHLDTRKAAIYENLRDLQFEYRVGKLSDTDYQRTKQELQAELAAVLAEIDQIKVGVPDAPAAAKGAAARVCRHCGAKFDKTLKFCGECGKSMTAQA